MPLYEYEHKQSGERVVVSDKHQKDIMDYRVQKGAYRRIFSFNTTSAFAAVNPDDPRAEPVTSKTRYKDELKRLSEEHSHRHNGMDVNYQPVEIRDPLALGVSEQGIESAAKRARDSGRSLPPVQHFT